MIKVSYAQARLEKSVLSIKVNICIICWVAVTCAVFGLACEEAPETDDDKGAPTHTGPAAPADHPEHAEELIYAFESRFVEGASSVSYSGQIARHALIVAMKSYISGLTDRLASGSLSISEGGVVDSLNLFFECADDLCADEELGLSTTPTSTQRVIGDLSSGKNLIDKIAGNDSGQHRDWATDFKGWGDEPMTPTALVTSWFELIEARSIAINNGDYMMDPSGARIVTPYVTDDGLDVSQLLQKFILGAVAFSQGVDDYLDDADEGKGLLADHTVAVEGKPYTALEHNWDEGFGYFGAARDYLVYTDDEIAKKGGREDYQGHHDTDANGEIDLTAEYNWGHALNAAKRDRGASTDFTTDAFMAFYEGRRLLASIDGALTDEELERLRGYRDVIVGAWENAIAATVIHYINDVIGDMEAGDAYDFYAHAKHWSEMKGFALSLQFNPRSPLSSDDFQQMHSLFGLAPELPNSPDADSSRSALLQARDLLESAYQFERDDVIDW
jgi:hypothetical protein